jgi:acyl dehydratase
MTMTVGEISRIAFARSDLNWFAEQSGDWNPIHIDAIAARRSMAGEVIVHGIFTLLWALESYCASSSIVPAKFKVSFHQPVLLGESITLRIEAVSSDEVRLIVSNQNEVVTTISAKGICLSINDAMPECGVPPRSFPEHLQFDDIKGRSGTVRLQTEADQINGRFPHLARVVGLLPITSILATSRIVGMKCPGLYSLYSGAEFDLQPGLLDPSLDWAVSRHTVAQAPIRIDVMGGGIKGRLDAFVRPAPVTQPKFAQIAANVETDLCRDHVAWVIGGGRGLGELMAKMIAAGNGKVVITYFRGREDADRVAAEITSSGGRCEVIELDVRDQHVFTNMLQRVDLPTHVYYFASSRISRPRRPPFDDRLFNDFVDIYVNSFARLISSLQRAVTGSLKVFYPSTVFINELPKEFPEYIAAKSAGETMCRYFTKQQKNIDVFVARLPRLPTDQTSGLIKLAMSDPIEHLLAVLREMSISENKHGNQK